MTRPTHGPQMTSMQVIAGYWDHAAKMTDDELKAEIDTYAAARAPGYDYEWLHVCVDVLRERAMLYGEPDYVEDVEEDEWYGLDAVLKAMEHNARVRGIDVLVSAGLTTAARARSCTSYGPRSTSTERAQGRYASGGSIRQARTLIAASGDCGIPPSTTRRARSCRRSNRQGLKRAAASTTRRTRRCEGRVVSNYLIAIQRLVLRTLETGKSEFEMDARERRRRVSQAAGIPTIDLAWSLGVSIKTIHEDRIALGVPSIPALEPSTPVRPKGMPSQQWRRMQGQCVDCGAEDHRTAMGRYQCVPCARRRAELAQKRKERRDA